MRWLTRAVLAVLVGAGPAAAEPPCHELDAWVAAQGDLQPGRACGSFVAATNAATIAYSFGQIMTRAAVAPPYRVSVTWRRLGSDARTLELHLLGGVVLFGNDEFALWTDDAHFELDGFHPLPGYKPRAVHRVSAVQRADAVEVEVDGVRVGRWALRAPPGAAPISIAFKGQRGARERIWFADVAITPLGAQSQAPSAGRSK